MLKIRNYTLLLIACLAFSVSCYAQSCLTATPVCNGTSFTISVNGGISIPTSLNVSNPINDPFPPNSGCMKGGSPNPNWMIITISGAGNLGFSISDNNSPNPQAGFYDWILWPYNSATCNDFINNAIVPVRCNYNFVASGGTGIGNLPAGASQGNYEAALPVTAGQQFLLLMNNYSGVTSLATFSSTGTASLNCSQVFNPDVITCANKTVSYTVNSFALSNVSFTLNPGNIMQSSPLFTLSSPVTQVYTITSSGYAPNSAIALNYNSTLTYSVHTPPAMTVTNPVYFCYGAPINFTVGPPGSYSVTMTNTLNNFSATFTTQQISTNIPVNNGNGPYTLTANYSTGCTTALSMAIDVASNLIVTASATPTSVCEGETFVLNASLPISANYLWTGPGSFTSSSASDSIKATLLQSGVYSVSAGYMHGPILCHTKSTVNVLVDPCTGMVNIIDSEKKLWPNPASELVYFSAIDGVTKIECVTISGIYKELKFHENKIEIGNLKEGVYLLKFHKEERLVGHEKLIILRH